MEALIHYGQVIDKFSSGEKTLVCVWDIVAKRRFTVESENLSIPNLVRFECNGFTDKVPETGVRGLVRVHKLPPGLKPLLP